MTTTLFTGEDDTVRWGDCCECLRGFFRDVLCGDGGRVGYPNPPAGGRGVEYIIYSWSPVVKYGLIQTVLIKRFEC